MLLLAVLVIAVAVFAVLRGREVRLVLLLAALALGAITGDALAVVRSFLDYFTAEQFLLPIGCCMGFAYVLRHTGCDLHLVLLLMKPLRRARVVLLPGVAVVGLLVNVPIISQASAGVTAGAVLVPILRSAGIPAATISAVLVLGTSMGGELLNPGAPEIQTIVEARARAGQEVRPMHIVARLWPMLLVHLAVTVPLFWWLNRHEGEEPILPTEQEEPQANVFKALVPLIPLALLFLTALPEPLRLLEVPREWLMSDKAARSAFGARLVAAAMLVGTVVAALAAPAKAGQVATEFFKGAGYALANITSVIAAASCFGTGVRLAGLATVLGSILAALPVLLMPLAAILPCAFAWLCGSGMASTQSLYGFFDAPAASLGADPLRVGGLMAIAAAAGRTMSPVAAVVLMAASLTGAQPLEVVKRTGPPLLAGLLAALAIGWLLA